ncbi:MAG: DUF58 domain-containing protein, partial [Dokdonella sp.]
RPEPLPIILDRRRIYTLPTGFGAAFALLLFVMLLGALNYGNNAAILLTCLLAATASGSLFFAFRNLAGLRLIGMRGVGEVHAGDVATVEMEFAPGLRDRASMYCRHDDAKTWFALPAGVNGNVQLNFPSGARGWWLPGRIAIATDYPLGLFHAWSWLHPDRPILLLPSIEVDPPPLPFDSAIHGDQAALGNDDEYSGLRDYRPSDPPRRIAWKASAHRDSLLTRESERHTGDALVLDYATLRGLDHEARISRLTAWVLAADALQSPYALLIPERRIENAIGTDHRRDCLRALALLQR